MHYFTNLSKHWSHAIQVYCMESPDREAPICIRESFAKGLTNVSLCRQWMTGPMTSVDPDQVENDAGMYWRTFYKLEKSFGESPNPLKMAQKVKQNKKPHSLKLSCCIFFFQMKTRVDEFKEHLPLIGSLFNPGLRDRHWEKMSAIASQDLKPNEVGFTTANHNL